VKTGLDPGTLARTLERYNDAARAGRDEEFGRSADTLVPLDTSHLFAIQTWPGIAGTTGGPRHDELARVLRPDRGSLATGQPRRRIPMILTMKKWHCPRQFTRGSRAACEHAVVPMV